MMPAPLGVDPGFHKCETNRNPPPTATRSSVRASSISGTIELKGRRRRRYAAQSSKNRAPHGRGGDGTAYRRTATAPKRMRTPRGPAWILGGIKGSLSAISSPRARREKITGRLCWQRRRAESHRGAANPDERPKPPLPERSSSVEHKCNPAGSRKRGSPWIQHGLRPTRCQTSNGSS
jgi:hypothetical protein